MSDNTMNTELNEFETKLRILQDILQKKKFALECILGICENIEVILTGDAEMGRDFLQGMAEEKQALINQVLEADLVFQRIFDGISTRFNLQAPNYAEHINALQADIRQVLELDVAIRAKEDRTRDKKLGNAAANLKKQSAQNQATRNYIIDKYKNNPKS